MEKKLLLTSSLVLHFTRFISPVDYLVLTAPSAAIWNQLSLSTLSFSLEFWTPGACLLYASSLPVLSCRASPAFLIMLLPAVPAPLLLLSSGPSPKHLCHAVSMGFRLAPQTPSWAWHTVCTSWWNCGGLCSGMLQRFSLVPPLLCPPPCCTVLLV